MNASNMKTWISDIEENQKALDWLEAYGAGLWSNKANGGIRAYVNYASAVTGSTEATNALSSYGTSMMHEIIEATIRGCQNTIELRKEQIRKEIGE